MAGADGWLDKHRQTDGKMDGHDSIWIQIFKQECVDDCVKFHSGKTSTSLKTTLTKNFNLRGIDETGTDKWLMTLQKQVNDFYAPAYKV